MFLEMLQSVLLPYDVGINVTTTVKKKNRKGNKKGYRKIKVEQLSSKELSAIADTAFANILTLKYT